MDLPRVPSWQRPSLERACSFLDQSRLLGSQFAQWYSVSLVLGEPSGGDSREAGE